MKYQGTCLYIYELNVPCTAGITIRKISLWAILNDKKCMSGITVKKSVKEIIDF